MTYEEFKLLWYQAENAALKALCREHGLLDQVKDVGVPELEACELSPDDHVEYVTCHYCGDYYSEHSTCH